ncbi:MAG: SDR family oxidoreductase [Candidatus Omnitrophota bacterium]
MKVAIIGASGFIGGYLFNFFEKERFDTVGTYFRHYNNSKYIHLDATNFDTVSDFVFSEKPDFLILTAANKNVQDCEVNHEQAYQINVKPIENIVKCLSRSDTLTKSIFFSSDYVFDGERGNYHDNDIPNPTTNYGKTKLIAEKILLTSSLDFKIVRTSAVIGSGSQFYDWLLNELQSKPGINAFSNVFFTPTPIDVLLNGILCLMNNWAKIGQKTLHIVGNRKMSRYEFCLGVKNLSKKYLAKIIAEEVDFSKVTLKKDLSLICSDAFSQNNCRIIFDYLE